MAQTSIGTIANTDSTFAITETSTDLWVDSFKGTYLTKVLEDTGVITIKNDLTKRKGGRLDIDYVHRISGKAVLGDGDAYSNSTARKFNADSMYIDRITKTVDHFTDGSATQQNVAFRLDDGVQRQLTEYFKSRFHQSIFYSLGGFNPTSITQFGETYTGSERNELWGFNTPTAPTRAYYANSSSNSSDTDVAADTTATLQLSELRDVKRQLMNENASGINFQTFKGTEYDVVVLVAETGFNQLLDEAQSNGNLTLSQYILSSVEAGKDKFKEISEFTHQRMKFICYPDTYAPYGVISNAKSSNVQRALICGPGALNVAFGAGFQGMGNEPVPGFDILVDTETKKLNRKVMTSIQALWGCKVPIVDSFSCAVATLAYYVA